MINNLMEEDKLTSEMNVIPFIDVILVLLFVFMATITISNSSIEVDLPKVDVSEKSPSGDSINDLLIITLKGSGDIYISSGELDVIDKKKSLYELNIAAAILFKNKPTTKVYLRADGEVNYKEVVNIMNQIKAQGFSKVHLVTDEVERVNI